MNFEEGGIIGERRASDVPTHTSLSTPRVVHTGGDSQAEAASLSTPREVHTGGDIPSITARMSTHSEVPDMPSVTDIQTSATTLQSAHCDVKSPSASLSTPMEVYASKGARETKRKHASRTRKRLKALVDAFAMEEGC